MDDFKIYKDDQLEVELDKALDLGKVKVGDTKQFTFYLYNSSIYPYEELELNTNREEVKVIEAPTEIAEKSSGKFILEYKPALNTNLKTNPTLEIKGYRVENL